MDDASTSSRSRTGLLLALAVDNLGSGLFLPLSLVYTTTVVGLPLSLAGLLVTAGTLTGLAAPPLTGRLVDRVGPRAVVVASQVLQATGMGVYLLAHGPGLVLLAAALVAAGTQTFYSALFALIADVAPVGPKDRPFAVVDMVRSAAFGLGALISALVISAASTHALRWAVVADGTSFVVAAAALTLVVRPRDDEGAATSDPRPPQEPGRPGVLWHDRPYLALIVVTALLALPADLFLIGMPVYALAALRTARWVPGASLALLTLASSTLTTRVVSRTRHWTRTRAMATGAWCFIAWAGAAAAAAWLPTDVVAPWLLASTLLLAAGSLLLGTRANALAEAAAPPAARGRYLAAFQYAFTAAGLAAPLLVSALAVALWLPWLVVAVAAVVGAVALAALARRLPAEAVRPHR